MRILALAALVLALGDSVASAGEAAAGEATAGDARAVAARVAEEWRKAGGRVTVLPTRFVFDEETVLVPVAEADAGATTCTEVAVIGARGISFRARMSDAGDEATPELAARSTSSAGILTLRRCDADRPVRHIVVTAEAGRGALEILVGRSAQSLPLIASLVPERAASGAPPIADAGVLPPLVAQEKRAEAAETRARREAAVVGDRLKARASDDGSGEETLELDPGCHRLELFGRELVRERPGRRFRLDIDAELRTKDELLARDRTEAPDARLETCVGIPTSVTLGWVGAPPHTEVVVTHASWKLPAQLPSMWGPVTRSRMARTMFLRHVAAPTEKPVYLTQGSTGSTPIPISVETGGCYVAVVGIARGHARQLQLRALVGARESTDERGAAEESALAAFCVRAYESARLEVLARGTGLAWGLALFRVKSGVWEAAR